MVCRVEVDIRATAETIWELLTNAEGFPNWNSTVTKIEGQIREGERLKIHVPGTRQTFKPVVSGLVPGQRMIWSSGINPIFKGVRTFLLRPSGDTLTEFVMEERFSGVVFALTRKLLPDFRPIFEAYATDLARKSQRLEAVIRSPVGVSHPRDPNAPA